VTCFGVGAGKVYSRGVVELQHQHCRLEHVDGRPCPSEQQVTRARVGAEPGLTPVAVATDSIARRQVADRLLGALEGCASLYGKP
jgi:hypothetical protein